MRSSRHIAESPAPNMGTMKLNAVIRPSQLYSSSKRQIEIASDARSTR
jgi:hypothetical protein